MGIYKRVRWEKNSKWRSPPFLKGVHPEPKLAPSQLTVAKDGRRSAFLVDSQAGGVSSNTGLYLWILRPWHSSSPNHDWRTDFFFFKALRPPLMDVPKVSCSMILPRSLVLLPFPLNIYFLVRTFP
jgi:hypothetical protein